jgi:ABC-type glycerol-3-phosphate transport system substrate-binding protein
MIMSNFSCKQNKENQKIEMSGEINIWHYDVNIAEMIKQSFEKTNDSNLEIIIKVVEKSKLKEEVLKSTKSKSEDLPDIIAFDNEILDGLLDDNEILMNLEDNSDFKKYTDNMYDYSIEKGKDSKENIKALALEVDPGAVIYKKDLGRKYLGSADEENVVEMFSSYENIIETGKKLVNESSEKAKMFTNTDDFFYSYLAGRTGNWFNENNEIFIDEVLDEFMKLTKRSDELNLDSDIQNGSEEWETALTDDIHFAFPINFSDLDKIKKIQNNETKYLERWGIVNSRYGYFNNSVWYGISNETSKPDVSWEFLKYIMNNKMFLIDYSTDNDKFCNNYEIIGQIAKDETYISDITGKNIIDEFNKTIDKDFVPLESEYDNKINELFIKYSNEYSRNEINYYEHMDNFKEEVNFLIGKTQEDDE